MQRWQYIAHHRINASLLDVDLDSSFCMGHLILEMRNTDMIRGCTQYSVLYIVSIQLREGRGVKTLLLVGAIETQQVLECKLLVINQGDYHKLISHIWPQMCTTCCYYDLVRLQNIINFYHANISPTCCCL